MAEPQSQAQSTESPRAEDTPAQVEQQPAMTTTTTPGSAVNSPEADAAASFQAQQERMKVLHKNCAEGDVLGVRGILSGSLELLESIDPATGLTPMLQAIYANQVEIVKELMMAGAYPPPPTVTSEPAILAVLYPQLPPAQFGMPPAPAHFAPMPNPASSSEFGYYGQPGSAQPAGGVEPAPVFAGNGQHRQSISQERHNDATKLPPTEVSKTIPCRNFPNCRYGDACVFQHPQPQHFYPSAPYQPAAEFVPGGFPGMPMYYGMPPPAPFVPLDAQTPAFAPPMPPAQHRQSVELNGAVPVAVSPAGPGPIPLNGAPEAQGSNGGLAQSGVPLQQAPVFHPRAAGVNGFPVGQMAFPQQNGFDQGKKGHHVKRMSFGGVPKAAWTANGGGPAATLARQAALGSWSNGQPPACVFFQNSKCRNGDMCKFPHIMPDGTDSRHPDVIAGTVAAAPVSNNPNFRPPTRGRVAAGNNFHFERQQHFMKVQAMRQQQAASRVSQPSTGTTSPTEKTEAAPEAEATHVVSETAPKADTATPAVPAAPKAQISAQAAPRTRSVPNTRAHSPNSNVVSNTSRGPRVGGRSAHIGNGQAARSTSIPAATKEVKQKLPSADDFPALAGSVGSLNGESGVVVKPGPYGNKTAAQVLSAPAPPKPVSAETEEVKTGSRSRASSVGQGLSTESDDEAVVISIKETPEAAAAPSVPAAASSAPKAPISFASVASKTSTEAPMMVASQA